MTKPRKPSKVSVRNVKLWAVISPYGWPYGIYSLTKNGDKIQPTSLFYDREGAKAFAGPRDELTKVSITYSLPQRPVAKMKK